VAAGWLLVALRVENQSASDIKNIIAQGTIGTGGKYLGRRAVNGISRLLMAAAGGTRGQGNLWATVTDNTGALSTGVVACVQANAAGNWVRWTFGAQTITLTEGVDFARGASNTTCAAALAAAINAHPVLGGLFTAVGSVGNCNITSKIPTALMHDITMTTDDATAFTFTQLTGGTEGAAQFFLQHFDLNRAP
jgi:hypothetical protein